MRVASRFRYTPRYGFSLLEYRWTGWPGYFYFPFTFTLNESEYVRGSFVVRQLDVTSELFG